LKAACKDLGDSADKLVIQPLMKQFLIFEESINEYLAKYSSGTDNGHPTDDSEDYTPGWIPKVLLANTNTKIIERFFKQNLMLGFKALQMMALLKILQRPKTKLVTYPIICPQ
jgi:hypothetical protein